MLLLRAVADKMLFSIFPETKVFLFLCGSNLLYSEYISHLIQKKISFLWIEPRKYTALDAFFQYVRKKLAPDFVIFYNIKTSLVRSHKLLVWRNFKDNSTNCPIRYFNLFQEGNRKKTFFLSYTMKKTTTEKYYRRFFPVYSEEKPYCLNIVGSYRSEGSLYAFIEFCNTLNEKDADTL